MSTLSYPVHVDAHLDPTLSRWLWLVKWFLAIPHFVVLAFLWAAFIVLSVVAFFAILFTGRYPASIFEFNVGVMRWTWRVSYYAYGTLGTDRYPPFTLHEVPDYPAHLTIDYPEHLSRGLVLVKWWLLAIPHYCVLALFLGGAYVTYDTTGSDASTGSGAGLIELLVLIAAIILLFTGRYPRAIFDLVLGLNRWVLRVAAYASLMTDQYPPFRLDQGGDDPDAAKPEVAMTAAPAQPAPPPAQPGSRWTAGRIIAVVAASIVILFSLGLGAAGGSLAFANSVMRDDAGYLMSDSESLNVDTYAITSDNLVIETGPGMANVPRSILGKARLTATGSDKPIFIGVARTADVDSYLAGVQHSVLVDLANNPEYRTTTGHDVPMTPTESDIWVTSAAGTGTQSVVWTPEDGDWTVVMMNADGSSSVAADVKAGATLPALDWLVPLLLTLAGLGLLAGILGLVLALRSANRS